MDELIKINYENDRPTVSGRELHRALGIGAEYVKWFSRMCEYGFVEGKDYSSILTNRSDGLPGKPRTDHALTISMAKELCMIQRTEIGRIFRQYFISVEDAWNSPEQVMARALKIAGRSIQQWKDKCRSLYLEVGQQQRLIDSMQPKLNYMDEILQSHSLVLTTQIAKDYGMSAVTLNRILNDLKIQYRAGEQWVLYARYQDKGYTHSRTFKIQRRDGEPIVKMQTEWTQKGRLFLYDELKSKNILPLIERG